MTRIKAVSIAVVGALVTGHAPNATSCAGLEVEGSPPIKVNSEAAIIIWDATRQIEHFIRRASFDSSGKSMGFLVPTPEVPTVTAACDDLYGALNSAVEPSSHTRLLTGYRLDWFLIPDAPNPASRNLAYIAFEDLPKFSATKAQSADSTKVGGYTATTIPARDERQLVEWLRTNKFKVNDDTRAWLAPYIRRGWNITAFKIQPGKTVTQLSPVRLSFKTPKPFYPYREPASARRAGNYAAERSLKVYYLSKERGDGAIGDGSAGASSAWPGRIDWSTRLNSARRDELLTGTGLKSWQIPSNARLTVFTDKASPRPGTDEVYFKPSPDQSTVAPDPIVRTTDRRIKLPLELVVLAIVSVSVGGIKLANRASSQRGRRATG